MMDSGLVSGFEVALRPRPKDRFNYPLEESSSAFDIAKVRSDLRRAASKHIIGVKTKDFAVAIAQLHDNSSHGLARIAKVSIRAE
jgi:hypothetical protein